MTINRPSLDYLQTQSAHHKGSSVHRSVSSTIGILPTLRVEHLNGFLQSFQVFFFFFLKNFFFCLFFFNKKRACGTSSMVFRKEPLVTELICRISLLKTLSLIDPLSGTNQNIQAKEDYQCQYQFAFPLCLVVHFLGIYLLNVIQKKRKYRLCIWAEDRVRL